MLQENAVLKEQQSVLEIARAESEAALSSSSIKQESERRKLMIERDQLRAQVSSQTAKLEKALKEMEVIRRNRSELQKVRFLIDLVRW